MINKSIQKEMGWCSVHTLQNIFQTNKLDNYLKDERYKGCGDKEVEELLSEIDDTLGVANVFYANQIYPSLPIEYVWDALNIKENCEDNFKIKVIPYLLTVKLISSCYHMVAVLNINGRMYYSDPYKEKWEYLEMWQDLNPKFKQCSVVQRLYIKEDQSWAILNGEYYGYDKFDF